MNDASITLRLSAQRALCGHVPTSLRSASIEKDGDMIRWRCVFDTQATENDFELARIAGTEIIADYSPPTGIDEQIVTTPFPQELEHLEDIVFLRHEHTISKNKPYKTTTAFASSWTFWIMRLLTIVLPILPFLLLACMQIAVSSPHGINIFNFEVAPWCEAIFAISFPLGSLWAYPATLLCMICGFEILGTAHFIVLFLYASLWSVALYNYCQRKLRVMEATKATEQVADGNPH